LIFLAISKFGLKKQAKKSPEQAARILLGLMPGIAWNISKKHV